MADMAEGSNLYRNSIKQAIDEVMCSQKVYDTCDLDNSKFLETLPEDFSYEITSLRGNADNFVAHVSVADLTEENYKDWLEDYSTVNNLCLRIKTSKSETSHYVLRQYYRCQHNTRQWSPSKDPQRKLTLEPTARVKNTNCPLQLILKISTQGRASIVIEWCHNHSISTLEASNFKDLSPETIEKVQKLYESGHTPSIARMLFLKDLKAGCKDELSYHKIKADRSLTPRVRDFNYIYQQFCEDQYGGRNSQMFSKLSEKFEEYKTNNPEASVSYQMYDGDDKPLIVCIVTPLMKRVHMEVHQSGELVFIDATSNTEEHNLKVFMLCTHHVCGALPLGIIITSDEKESTLTRGFQSLQSILPTYAFYGNGPEVGPRVILTDNCDEERNALGVVWPQAILLLCIFHLLQQLWKWLHHKNHNIAQENRPYLLSLFKKCLYAETEELFEDYWTDLLEDDRCKKYENLISYLTGLCENKEAFALCYRSQLLVRGNHTNNFVEAQFLVLKDNVLRRVKEFNVVGLFEKLTSDLEDHYKTKLLSIADRSFDGQYRRRFLGKGEDGGTGFKLPTQEEQTAYMASVKLFGNGVFRIASCSIPEQSYTVDMTVVGVCSCSVVQDGSPCKHQYVLWAAKKASCSNFVPITNPGDRQKLALIATEDSLPLSFYNNLRTVVNQNDQVALSEFVTGEQAQLVDDVSSIEPVEQAEQVSGDANDQCIDSAAELLKVSYEQIAEKLTTTKDPNLAKAIVKFSSRVKKLTGHTKMHANLATALFNFGFFESKKTGKSKKKVQPNRKRKSGNGSRQAVKKGRTTTLSSVQPELEVPTKKPKRRHDLARAEQANVNNSKKSGSHVMRSKTKHIQKSKKKTELSSNNE